MSFKSDNVFKFKNFEIKQDQCAMKVGTDGVLLGAWTRLNSDVNILDIGTGTGLIALMLAQRSEAIIDAIEIDEAAHKQSCENFNASPWAGRIKSIHVSLQDFLNGNKKYDLIISNPPYFINAHKSDSNARNVARHTGATLTFDELILGANRLLRPTGRLCVILPIMEGDLFTELCEKAGFYIHKITRVKTKEDKSAKRQLLEFSLSTKKSVEYDELVILKEDGSFTDDYISLTKDFYTHYPARTNW